MFDFLITLLFILFPLGLLAFGGYSLWNGVNHWKTLVNKPSPNDYANIIGPVVVLLLGLAVVWGEIKMFTEESSTLYA